MTNRIRSINKTYIVNVSSLSLLLIVSMSYFVHIFNHLSLATVYVLVLEAAAILYVVSKPVHRPGLNGFTVLWVFCFILVIFSYIRTVKTNDVIRDIIVFSCGVLIVFSSSWDEKKFMKCLTLIKILAAIFAGGVFLQYFFPTQYYAIMSLLPRSYSTTVISSGLVSGFTVNVSYTCGYINAGILASISSIDSYEDIDVGKIAYLVCLFIATGLTGKRGPTIFLIMTIAFCYLISGKGIKKIEKYLKIGLLVFSAIIIFFTFENFIIKIFMQIPAINRIVESIGELSVGQDISSSRLMLYQRALQLFWGNRLLGIGWSAYRTNPLGGFIGGKYLDVHNIYIQLLCEMGIVGFAIFITMFIVFWRSAKNNYCKLVQQKDAYGKNTKKLLFFTLAYQTYFLLYGLTGNPLYDVHFQIIYILSCAISSSFQIYVVEKKT